MPLALSLRGLARRRDPATSKQAAARVRPPGIGLRVLAELRQNGPGSSHDLAERLGLSLVTVSPRLAPLEALELVERSGVDYNNRTIWKATKKVAV